MVRWYFMLCTPEQNVHGTGSGYTQHSPHRMNCVNFILVLFPTPTSHVHLSNDLTSLGLTFLTCQRSPNGWPASLLQAPIAQITSLWWRRPEKKTLVSIHHTLRCQALCHRASFILSAFNPHNNLWNGLCYYPCFRDRVGAGAVLGGWRRGLNASSPNLLSELLFNPYNPSAVFAKAVLCAKK